MSLQVGLIEIVLVLALSACSGVADPMGLPPGTAGGDLQSVVDAAGEGGAGVAAQDARASTVQGTSSDAAAQSASSESPTVSSLVGDGSIADAGTDGPDSTIGVAYGDAAPEASVDVVEAAAPAPVTCSVTFTVADAFIDGVIDTGVALGGDTAALGNWDPNGAVAMTSLGAGAWTLSLVMTDSSPVQFLFVKRGPNSYAWEDWGVNSNRSLVVSCTPEPDAGEPVDGGPVVGTSYAGQFGVKPPDAT